MRLDVAGKVFEVIVAVLGGLLEGLVLSRAGWRPRR